jgi:hypothetical protein
LAIDQPHTETRRCLADIPTDLPLPLLGRKVRPALSKLPHLVTLFLSVLLKGSLDLSCLVLDLPLNPQDLFPIQTPPPEHGQRQTC